MYNKNLDREALIGFSLRPPSKEEITGILKERNKKLEGTPGFEESCEEHAERLEAFLKEFHKGKEV